MNLLFIAGPGRSGTTALVRYLNVHPEILVCRERFAGWPREEITKDLFTPETIMDFPDVYEQSHRNTELRWRRHAEILDGKDFSRLSWVGDKVPTFTDCLPLLAENNPDSKFLLMYRPVEDVARSAEARSANPKDTWLGNRDGFRVGVKQWSRAMRKMLSFLDSGGDALVVDYDGLFGGEQAEWAYAISLFLGLNFGPDMLDKWQEMSRGHERRAKEPTTEREQQLVEELSDRRAEARILECMERHRSRHA